MKNLTSFLVAMLLFGACKPINKELKPNVLLIIADDLRTELNLFFVLIRRKRMKALWFWNH
jgi:hypothetical protein